MINMNDVTLFLLAFTLTGVLACVIYGIRNDLVFHERCKIVDKVSELAKQDISNNKDYKWRYEEFESIRYIDMVLLFWVPIKSFYKNKDCIKPLSDLEETNEKRKQSKSN